MIEANVKQDLREIGKKLTDLRGLFDLDLKQEMISNFEEKWLLQASGIIQSRHRA